MKPMNFWNNKENCFEEAKKYKTIYELERNCYGCYKGLKRNNWLYEAYPILDGRKPMNFWRSKEEVIKASNECTSKMEFKRKYGGAFNSAIKNGWMDEIEKHFHKPKVYAEYDEKRHVVYVYEIENMKTCYVGRTVNLHKRDLGHRRKINHKDGTVSFDALYKFCDDNKIDIPAPIIKEENLNAIESLEKEDFWVKKYKDDGWNVLNKSKTGVNSGSLGGVIKWDYDKCKNACKNFKYKNEVKKFNYSCYVMCLKNKWFDEFGIINKYNYGKKGKNN